MVRNNLGTRTRRRRAAADVRAPTRRTPRLLTDAASVTLAVVAIAALGLHPAALAGVYLAAVTPELARVDLREHRLPNRMVVPGLVAGLAGAALSAAVGALPAAAGAPPVPIAAGLAFGGLLLLLSLGGGIGMGDVKLAALIGLASPTPGVAVAAPVLAFLAGGVVAAVALARRGRGARIPFGPALLGGYWAAVAVAVGLSSGWGGSP